MIATNALSVSAFAIALAYWLIWAVDSSSVRLRFDLGPNKLKRGIAAGETAKRHL